MIIRIRDRRAERKTLLLQLLVLLLAVLVMPHNMVGALGVGALPVVGMIIDVQQQFSAAQALVGTAVSTNSVDLGPPNTTAAERRIGTGEPMAVLVTIGVGAVGGGTLTVDVQTDDNSAFSSAAIHTTSGAIAAAALGIGAKLVIPLIPGKITERYMRLNYTMVTMTNITVSAELQPLASIQNEQVYPKNFVISV